MTPAPGATTPAPELPLTSGQLAILIAARFVLNVAFRIVYPLQPFLSGSLHVDLATVSGLVTVQLLASVVSLLGGALSDSRGERWTMSAGLSLFCAGALLCAVSQGFSGFLGGYALIGLGVALFQPSAAAYLSARTSYAQRGRALGLYETSWAVAALAGVAPLMYLLERVRSTAPIYLILLAGGVGALALVQLALPGGRRRHDAGPRRPVDWAAVRTRSVLGVLTLMPLAMLAYDMYSVAQASWLRDAFGASEGQQGQAFAVAGAAEMVGSVAVALLADRLGKKRAALGGFVVAAACVALLPLSAGSWPLLIAVLFAFYLAEEFAIVAAIPLASGVAPSARGTVFAMMIAISSMGRAMGAAASAEVYGRAGIGATTAVAAAATLAGVLAGALLIREVEADRDAALAQPQADQLAG